jgi:predicted RNA binding protein YcfA (HicA-like mRNA interferase family)
MNGMFFIPHMNVVFHVKLLNMLGFVQLPEKVLDKYFEIKGVLAIFSVFFLGHVMCKLFKHEQQETHLDTKNEKGNTLSWIFIVMNGMFFIPHMNVVFHVKLLNMLGFVQLPEKVLD